MTITQIVMLYLAPSFLLMALALAIDDP